MKTRLAKFLTWLSSPLGPPAVSGDFKRRNLCAGLADPAPKGLYGTDYPTCAAFMNLPLFSGRPREKGTFLLPFLAAFVLSACVAVPPTNPYSTASPELSFAAAPPVAPEADPDDVKFRCWFDTVQSQRLCSAKVTDVSQITCETDGRGAEDCFGPKSVVGPALPPGQSVALPVLPLGQSEAPTKVDTLKELAKWQIEFFDEIGSNVPDLAPDAALLKPPWELLAADSEQNQDAGMAEMCEPQRAAAATEVGSHILKVMAYRAAQPAANSGKVVSLKKFLRTREQGKTVEKALRAEGEFLVNVEPRCSARQAAEAQVETQREEQIHESEVRLHEIDEQVRQSQLNQMEDLMILQALRTPPPTFIVTPPSGPVF